MLVIAAAVAGFAALPHYEARLAAVAVVMMAAFLRCGNTHGRPNRDLRDNHAGSGGWLSLRSRKPSVHRQPPRQSSTVVS